MEGTGSTLIPLIAEEAIQRRVAELGTQISRDYRDRSPRLLVVGVLKGAWMFMADLVRGMDIPVECDFLRVSSYDSGTERSPEVRLLCDVRIPVEDREVLLVEDIVDTGHTVQWICDVLRPRRPRSLEVCTLLDKPSRRKVDVQLKYVGFTVPDRFVVGYGLDVDEQYRHLASLAYVAVDAS